VVAVLADAGSFATLPIVERMVDKYCRPARISSRQHLCDQPGRSRRSG
jgi:hypothetical protein